MKKLISALLVVAMMLALAACGSSTPAQTEAAPAAQPAGETQAAATEAEIKPVTLTIYSPGN